MVFQTVGVIGNSDSNSACVIIMELLSSLTWSRQILFSWLPPPVVAMIKSFDVFCYGESPGTSWDCYGSLLGLFSIS